MDASNVAQKKQLTVFLVSARGVERARLCHLISSAHCRAVLLESIDDVMLSDVRLADVFLVSADDTLICDLLKKFAEAEAWCPVVAFELIPSPDAILRALKAGAVKFLSKPTDPFSIRRTLEHAINSTQALRSKWVRSAQAEDRLRRLSPREREVISLVAQGCSNKEIGRALAIRLRTVEIYRARALEKLGTTHTAEAVRLVIEAEWAVAQKNAQDGWFADAASIKTSQS